MKKDNRSSGLLLCLLSAVLTLAFITSCRPSLDPDIERGSGYAYREGYPEVRLAAIGLLTQNDESVIHITSDIVKGSLIFEQEGDQLEANFNVDIQIFEQGDDATAVTSESHSETITASDPDIVHSSELFTFEREISVDPGQYRIVVTVVDESSQNQTVRQAETFIPDPNNEVINLTNIQMQIKDTDVADPRWVSATTYNVPGKVDSIKFLFQVTNNRSENPLSITSNLLRFESDTSIARMMHQADYSASSLQYDGVDYDEEEVLQSTERTLSQAGSVLIEYKFAAQPRGVYRFEVFTSGGDEEERYKGRSFSFKSRNYPAVESARELARPLAYLMHDGEYEELMAVENADSLKREIDRFWLRNVGDQNKATNVIRMYYERVEEANKRFSNYKEGWKTDRGMMYVLFGPPWYVDEYFNAVTWSYSYNRTDPEYNFTFRQPQVRSELYEFENYLLQRRRGYYDIQYRQIQRWLSGQILVRDI